jgi:putative acetyltransferase
MRAVTPTSEAPSDGVLLRVATIADVEDLVRVSRAAIEVSAVEHYAAEQRTAWADRRTIEFHRTLLGETHTVVAVIDDVVAGFVSVALDATPRLVRGEVDQLFVDPAFGGRGIARALLADVDRIATAAGLDELTTHASWRAVPVFERAGYVRGATEEATIGDVVLTRAAMRKRLARSS